MKATTIFSWATALSLLSSNALADEHRVQLSGVATASAERVILDVYADSESELRSFGFRVLYDAAHLLFRDGERYDGLWFLADESHTHFVYGEPTEPSPGQVRLVGGRLGGSDPSSGVSGGSILLATLEFERRSGKQPEFSFALASPEPFANFVSVDGDVLDEEVTGFHETVRWQVAEEDTDGDGLPDPYELETFGDLKSSDGSGDSDGDGMSDKDEWSAGTDPTDATSRLQLRVSRDASGQVVLSWDSQPGRIYRIDWSRTLDDFDLAAEGIAATPAENSLLAPFTEGNDQAFYRLSFDYPTMGR